ncbi:hypothetical protein H5410_057541 [Solanum commersonii]|uniref:Uncharacterized protein n=1 Tax=Solanum commersonii TaxID=4109 RepID=A0A9J5WQC8_SOLCO|nr:hypothetical protein H5410_057541 [Solanum commersonii]
MMEMRKMKRLGSVQVKNGHRDHEPLILAIAKGMEVHITIAKAKERASSRSRRPQRRYIVIVSLRVAIAKVKMTCTRN